MNRFEGLDLVGLMELLHGLVEPQPVSMWPQTQGWWTLAAWLIAVVLIGVFHWLSWRRRNRYRREAGQELDRLALRAEEAPGDAAQAIAALVKRTALAAYPREKVASLAGDDWVQFLNETSNADSIVTNGSAAFATAAYRPGMDGRELVAPARRWIQVHRA